MTPDAIFVFSAGFMPCEGGGLRTTTYDESDAFGTLGGRDRVEAGALLAKKYPNAYIVTTCKRADGILPTLASVYADELQALGVAPERIVKEENSINTGTSISEAIRLAKEKGWRNLVFVSNGFQGPRIRAFLEQEQTDIMVEVVASESVLIENNPAYAEYLKKVKASPAYANRLAAEARGIAAIKSGTYQAAPIDDKKERPI